jgi:hypothetical protein
MERDRARWRLVENDEAIPLVVESNTFSRSDWAEMRRIAEQLSKNAVHSRSARVAGVR